MDEVAAFGAPGNLSRLLLASVSGADAADSGNIVEAAVERENLLYVVWSHDRGMQRVTGRGRRGPEHDVARAGGAVDEGPIRRDRHYYIPPLERLNLDDLLATVEAYLQRLLPPQGLEEADAGGSTVDEWAEEAPVLAGLAAASVQGRVAPGSRAGARVRRGGASLAAVTDPPGLGPCQARHNGFDLHAALCVPAGQRDRLERVCRYALRPPIAQDRLELTAEGQVQLQSEAPMVGRHYGICCLTPVELLERLATLTPRPRINLILHYGVLAPRAAWRADVVRFGEPVGSHENSPPEDSRDAAGAGDPPPAANGLWAEFIRRSFGFDVLECPRCGGRLQLIAVIEDPAVIERILRHPGLPTDIPEARPARPPPMPFLLDGLATAGGDDQILVDTRS